MGKTLVDISRDQPGFLDGKSFRQVIQWAGNGKLLDGSAASSELRDWLSAIPLERLRLCVEECLGESFGDGGLALQDAANELGRRLGFDVAHGRYRGVKGQTGNDGLWRSKDGFTLLVEVKTTDAYRMNLDTLSKYREELIVQKKCEQEDSSILICVGREDTGDLEAQIRGSRHAWDIRVISLGALLHLAEVKEELSDWDTSNKINQLLRPVEYTRLDGIVDLLFAAKRDLETPQQVVPPTEGQNLTPATALSAGTMEKAREAAIAAIARKLSCTFVRRGRALRAASDGTKRLVCLASQRYDGPAGSGNYWYGFTPSQRSFLSEGGEGWIGLVSADSGQVYLIPWTKFSTWLPDFLTTPASPKTDEEIRHWHVYFNDFGSRVEMMKSGGGVKEDIVAFQVPMG